MMTLEEFTKKVVEGIKDYLPEKFKGETIEITDSIKNNVVLKGLVITSPGKNVCPTIYVEHFYNDYKSGRDIEEVLKAIAEARLHFEVNESVDVEKLLNFAEMKNTIFPRLYNAENNPILEEALYLPVENTNLVVAFATEFGMENGVGSISVSTNLAKTWGVSAEELYELAFENSKKDNPPVIINMKELLYEFKKADYEAMFGENAREQFNEIVPPLPMFVASNTNRRYGATVVLDKDFMSEVKEQLGEFIIIPSSVHEVILIPQNEEMSYDYIKEMVQEVNDYSLAAQERLSYELYTIHNDSLKVLDEEDFKLPVNLLD